MLKKVFDRHAGVMAVGLTMGFTGLYVADNHLKDTQRIKMATDLQALNGECQRLNNEIHITEHAVLKNPEYRKVLNLCKNTLSQCLKNTDLEEKGCTDSVLLEDGNCDYTFEGKDIDNLKCCVAIQSSRYACKKEYANCLKQHEIIKL
jgi:hypothetical protein